MADLPTTAFLALCERFFDASSNPMPFSLRDKRNTQDDPFDEFLATDVLAAIDGVSCAKASGPLITPDMVLYRSDDCRNAEPGDLADDLNRIVGIEVKKLERTAQGKVARASGLDYNTTPPCGRMRVYDAAGKIVDTRGFYLFVCMENALDNIRELSLTAMCLVDGNVINEDFDLYLSITGEREKELGLGSYGDGANRNRPMLIFSNPLGIRELDRYPTLVHATEDLSADNPELALVHRLYRSVAGNGRKAFCCYRRRSEVPAGWAVTDLLDPFPTPARETRTQPRGRFKLPFRL